MPSREYIDLSEFYPLIAEVIEKGGDFRFYPRGESMEPLLHAGRDSVVLSAVDSINEGDVLFYRRSNGAFVLHRLIEKRGNTYTMCGDHQMCLEFGVKREQILAKMTGYYTEEEYHSLDTKEYRDYTKKLIRRFPFYRRDPKIYTLLKKIKRLFKKG